MAFIKMAAAAVEPHSGNKTKKKDLIPHFNFLDLDVSLITITYGRILLLSDLDEN